MGFDISSLSVDALNQTARIEPIFDKAGKPYPDAWIEVVSIDSDRYREAQRKTNQHRLDRTLSAGRAKLSADEMEDEALDMLASCTVNWGGFVAGGEPWPCNAENARKLYVLAPWIKEQVSSAIGDRRNFLTASSNGSLKQ